MNDIQLTLLTTQNQSVTNSQTGTMENLQLSISMGNLSNMFSYFTDMKALFDTVSVDRILSFVKEIHLFSNICTKLFIVLLL